MFMFFFYIVFSFIFFFDSFGFLFIVFFDDIDDDNVEKEIFEVIMNKGVIGLGFLIEGGKVLVKGD